MTAESRTLFGRLGTQNQYVVCVSCSVVSGFSSAYREEIVALRRECKRVNSDIHPCVCKGPYRM